MVRQSRGGGMGVERLGGGKGEYGSGKVGRWLSGTIITVGFVSQEDALAASSGLSAEMNRFSFRPLSMMSADRSVVSGRAGVWRIAVGSDQDWILLQTMDAVR